MAAAGGAPPGRMPGPPPGYDRWTIVYPCYVDLSKKCSEGRRLPKSKLEGCEGPHMMDLAEAAVSVGIPGRTNVMLEENRRHPRDFFGQGRIRVNLFKEDGSPVVPGITNKAKFLVALAAAIPKLPNRIPRLEAIKRREEAMKDQIMSAMAGRPMAPPGMGPPPAAAPPAAAAASAASSKPKKGGKGKIKRKPKKK